MLIHAFKPTIKLNSPEFEIGMPKCRHYSTHNFLLQHNRKLRIMCDSRKQEQKTLNKEQPSYVMLVTQLCLTLFYSMTVALQASLFMGFFRQEYWSGLSFLSPGDLPDPGIETGSPALQADSLQSEPPGQHLILQELQL